MHLLRSGAQDARGAVPPAIVRNCLEGDAPFDRKLWQEIARMGWTGTAIPEEYGGDEGLCVLAEELGRVLAPVPFASSV